MKEGEQHGLYVEEAERDACGVGLMADLRGIGSHQLVDDALTILENMKHRGATGSEPNTGDGAGILTKIPHSLFKTIFEEKDIPSPREGKYGVGMFFLPRDEAKRAYCMSVIREWTERKDFKIFLERKVPTDHTLLGRSALSTEPYMLQLFFKTARFNNKDIERRFYFLRSSIMKTIYFSDKNLTDEFYIASLSSQTIVYKGLLTAQQLRPYFKDLNDPSFSSPVAIVHSRFSTNTIPKWKLAQPFRCIAHNGEINTIKGNINWWNARERHMELIAKDRQDLINVFPVCDPFISDSGNFDNVVDFLLRASRSIPHSIMMMIPEAWQNDPEMEDYKRAFYEYHDGIMEPWDGPASICFTDGTIVGATLDRNGLRPSRYLITKDDLLILGSEAGCLQVNASNIKMKGRLQPGKMLVADLDEHRIISDEELKETICNRKPYRDWLSNNALHVNDLDDMPIDFQDPLPLVQRQQLSGMTQEDVQVILASMQTKGTESIGSMGADIPLALLSTKAQHVANYFRQEFAQVTNPPIDPLRENYYMSIETAIGGGSRIIGTSSEEAYTMRFNSPILSRQGFVNIQKSFRNRLEIGMISSTYPKEMDLETAIKSAVVKSLSFIKNDKRILCISDVHIENEAYRIPSLLLTGALHHYLMEKGLRKEVAILVQSGDIWETHHVACLLSYGADLIFPYTAIDTVRSLDTKDPDQAEQHYIKAINKGLMKIMSKLGISTLPSYKGAQTFEILGLASRVVELCFKGSISRIGGLDFEGIEREQKAFYDLAHSPRWNELVDLGIYQWKKEGEYHLFNPTTIHLLQHATSQNKYETYKQFAKSIDDLAANSSTLRSYLQIKPSGPAIPIEEVEPIELIFKRFATGAMSLGSLSHEAHSTLAIAMNRIGGKSNSGEGGEDKDRFQMKENGDWERSAIKQVASGRFGVDIHYLTNANEIQIKMAQGAKPGEGGQLPGHKVDDYIGKIRNATPGVSLISPPPHHDIYSIEDLAQLIFDLKNANPSARISVKLVSKAGVGVIASGVAKAHADHILISGCDGGTGASPLTSIRYAGLPWEMGLAETHQTLLKNGLRDRIVLQADGQIRTGRDLAIATLLGAEEWGIATAALVVEGCILMRKCHLNTCPVGIATQDESLRSKFNGKVDHLVNYFTFLAQHLREIMASLGMRSVDEMVGRSEFLEQASPRHWKHEHLQIDKLLHREAHKSGGTPYYSVPQDHEMDDLIDWQLIKKAQSSIVHREPVQFSMPIRSTDRAVGTLLSHELTKLYGYEGLAEKTIAIKFSGSAGQSFGAFATRGLLLALEGEANDYVGKGLSGGELHIYPPKVSSFIAENHIIVGNVALYGATAGSIYINGQGGDRFAVRNSGATAVVEGIGDNGCEYMTGGEVIILGKVGRNFGAGMSGGVAYLFREDKSLPPHINLEMIHAESPDKEDLNRIKSQLIKHHKYTGSALANKLLNKWEIYQSRFIKLISADYQAALEKLSFRKQKIV